MSKAANLLEEMKNLIPVLKQCQVLGIEVLGAEPGHLILLLPYSDKIVGNPDTGVIHGGPLTTLMDTACGFAAITALKEPGIAPTLDLRIDYMRSAIPGKAVIGSAEAYRVTRNVIFARGIAYHEGLKDKPIAHCTATFMRIDPSVTSRKEAS